MVTQKELEYLNRGNTPTFIGARGSFIIDQTLATCNLAGKISNWAVNSKEATLSDHRMVSYQIQMPEPVKVMKRTSTHTPTKQKWRSSARHGNPAKNGLSSGWRKPPTG